MNIVMNIVKAICIHKGTTSLSKPKLTESEGANHFLPNSLADNQLH